jgi:putative nucleotidyltransferase with HDIG domain
MVLGRVGYRVKQSWFLLFAKMNSQDKTWVRSILNIKEAALFELLPEFEQKHSVQAARTMIRLGRSKGIEDERMLAKLGLLHDVGKAACRLGLFEKGILVFLNAFIPPVYNWFAYLGRREKSPQFFRKFYVHKKHAKIGARMLSRAGVERDVIQAVTLHGSKIAKNSPLLAQLLKAADETY